MKYQLSTVGRVFALTFSATVVLSACGGGSEDGAGTMDLGGLVVRGMSGDSSIEVNPWLVTIRTFRAEVQTPGSGDARISTLQYNGTRTVQDNIDYYNGLVELDTCEINTDNGDGGGSGGDGPPYVTAGESVVINEPGGTWFTINQGEPGRYEVNNELPDAIPQGATVSIPGAVFPSVGAIPITEPAPPLRLLPDTGPVNAASEYSWVPGNGAAGQFMRLAFLEYDNAGNFIDFRIGCDLVDDGAFTLPVDVRFEISNNVNFLEVRYARQLRSVEVVDGVVVYKRAGVAE